METSLASSDILYHHLRNPFQNSTIQANGSPVLIISPNGDITWKGRVIEGDDEFREAVIGLYKHLSGYRL